MQDQRTTLRRQKPERAAVKPLAVDIREAAAMVGLSYMTIWRAIKDGQFPGVKVRDRIIVPLKAIEMLLDAATTSGELVDAAEWTAAWSAQSVPAAEGVA